MEYVVSDSGGRELRTGRVRTRVYRDREPGQSIQQAINNAAEGAIICLSAGTFDEKLKINKGITLRGAGREQTNMKSIELKLDATILIVADAEIEVSIESLSILATDATYAYGVEARGMAKVTILDSRISGHERGGLYVTDSAQLRLTNSRISSNGNVGLEVSDSGQVNLTNSQVVDNRLVGLLVHGYSRVSLTDSQVSGHYLEGIAVVGAGQVSLTNSQVSSNLRWYS